MSQCLPVHNVYAYFLKIQRLQEENCKEWTLREERETELSNVNRELKQAQQTITVRFCA